MSRDENKTRQRILAATLKLMEEGRGQEVRMGDIAKAAGISRQAVYLHFASRAELLVATTHYVDEVSGIDGRLQRWEAAPGGEEKLAELVEFWAGHLPIIYGVSKALLAARETDEAAAAAWDDRMAAVRRACRATLERLESDGRLAPEWTLDAAVDLLWTLLSVRNWALFTVECGWSAGQYAERMQTLVRRTFVAGGQ